MPTFRVYVGNQVAGEVEANSQGEALEFASSRIRRARGFRQKKILLRRINESPIYVSSPRVAGTSGNEA